MDKQGFKLKLYNSESEQKEIVAPMEGHTIKLYTCGPTVYNFAHIGNFRTYVFEDLLRRSLKFFGMQVNQVMNITDVEDKIIKAVWEKGQDLKSFTTPFIDAFFADLDALNIERAEHYPKATDYIPEMIAIIADLLEKGIAYKGADGSIYFSIDKFPSYGRLSHLHLDELQAGASERVAADEYDKENVSDFVLWKAYQPEKDGKVFWQSPFGPGRPGWHIECSAMAMKILGESIDIHVGGIDNRFPHHENEIAQSESHTGQHFVRHWLHCYHLLVDHKKMSKSLGNFYTQRNLLEKGYSGRAVRYMLLHVHYRSELNFTLQGLDGATQALRRIYDFVDRLRHINQTKDTALVKEPLSLAFEKFAGALSDDLNISGALAALFDLIHEIHALCDREEVGKEDAKQVLSMLKQFDAVLGVIPLEQSHDQIPQEIVDAFEGREKARKEKNWQEADLKRKFILERGYLIEDSPQGSRLKKA